MEMCLAFSSVSRSTWLVTTCMSCFQRSALSRSAFLHAAKSFLVWTV